MSSPMLSTVKEQLIKVVDLIPGLRSRRNAMAETPPFKATDTFAHRYQDEEVLRKALVEICGFTLAEIRIQITERNGFDVQLPRPLDEVR
ncbi:hypothetical protein F5B22DRAFT_595579 [Xylaria bambusicola]|uniref:uncharacterized protein n=1 Tax=Xylaria bambusicola TaxID=326684 RepID=UPI002007C093|nr:uncharacterized protein F5B22DRAFT_595579 [Xylaria bambusicola]KAI0521588.1 hypothetical protein F5B22DRAFT_595579 [Xylaria bambusicola]